MIVLNFESPSFLALQRGGRILGRDALLSEFLPGDKGPYALTPNTVKLLPTIGTLFLRGGPVQDPALTRIWP